ncbi:MAG: exosortase-associated EpsI family protein [Verrucomicrobiota bacterium]
MKKTPWILFATALALIASTGGFLFHLKGKQTLGKPGVMVGNVPLFDTETNRVAETTVILPEKIPGYFSVASPVTPIEVTMLPKDTVFGKRRYWTDAGGNADISVVLMGQDRTSLHKPQFCLVGQGWSIDQSEVVKLKMDRPYPYELPIMKLTTSIRVKDDKGKPFLIHGLYLYWFVSDKNLTASHDERMISTAKNLLRTGTLERWAYISYFTRCLPGQEQVAYDQLTKFIVKSAPEFQLVAGKPLPGNAGGGIQTASK